MTDLILRFHHYRWPPKPPTTTKKPAPPQSGTGADTLHEAVRKQSVSYSHTAYFLAAAEHEEMESCSHVCMRR